MSGQLYTTHLLSLEALLTVIDSIEAHCQAKVVNGGAHLEPLETLSGEGISSDTSARAGRRCREWLVLFLPFFIKPLPPDNIQRITNGLDAPGGPAAPGQQMPEKMRPGRQDPGDGEAGEAWISAYIPGFTLSLIEFFDHS